MSPKASPPSAGPTCTVRALCVLWPAFMVAGVLEMLVFSLVDPSELHLFGSQPLEWPPIAVYSVAFLAFWALVAIASAITQMLTRTDEPPVAWPGPQA